LAFALVSTRTAALTAVLAKVGVEGVPSNLATAIRTIVITGFAWAIVVTTGELHAIPTISRRSF
jgi:transporter family protein